MRASGAALANRRVLVLGASGALGRRIVRLLRQDLPALEVGGACRHPARLPMPDARYLDLGDASSVAPALAGVDLLIHAAGPFRHDPRPLVAACRAAGVHYLDLAEDPAFVDRVRQAARDLPGRGCVVPGCSTVPGLVVLLARCLEPAAARGDVRSVEAFLSLGSRNPVSTALLFGLLRPLGALAPDGRTWYAERRRFRFADGTTRTFGSYPIAIAPGEELALGGRRVPLALFVGFDRSVWNALLARTGSVVSRLSDPGLERLCRLALPAARAAGLLGGREGRLAIVARDARAGTLGALEVRAAREGLDVPAAPAIWATRRLLGDEPAPAGPCSLDALVSPQQALDWLTAHGCHVETS